MSGEFSEYLQVLRSSDYVSVTVVLGSISVGSVLLVPLILMLLPSDWFVTERRIFRFQSLAATVLWVVLLIVKNIVALALIAAGVAMLVLPGQGLLTILVAVLLLDFPGKRRVERSILSRGSVVKRLNWLRAKVGREPFDI